ncbi:hypothetical protein RHMOL_Rhmol01G0154500 [Rhododendron molle]|uniref:Uncharacterized protein n=1 Tax=Rhododendron molle TaxID=49168 RepID=A0ACC0Q1H5_RHOML|nr:hypothetical protein RHMOL_Rhmol01G0154500 [Rhododendron molle]
MADCGDTSGGGEVVDLLEDRGGPMATKTAEQKPEEAVASTGAVATSGGDGVQEQQQETAGGEVTCAIEAEPRATVQAGAVGPRIDPAGPSSAVEGSPVVRGSSDVAGSNDTRGDDIGPIESPLRDSAKGKGVIAEEERVEEVRIEEVQTTEVAPVEIREEDIAFRPPVTAATSSHHVPITYADIAEHAPDKLLAKLLEDHPIIGEYVLKAKEDRAWAFKAAKAAARAEREAERERAGSEGLAADIEAEERDAEEA